jgi:hypothetical protein
MIFMHSNFVIKSRVFTELFFFLCSFIIFLFILETLDRVYAHYIRIKVLVLFVFYCVSAFVLVEIYLFMYYSNEILSVLGE